MIRDNLVVPGGGAPVQGVFIRGTFDKLPFQRVTLEGNTILGGAYEGLAIDGVIDGRMADNTVLGYADQRSWIRLVADHKLELTGNTATFFNLENRADPRLAANSLVEQSEGAAQAAVRAWMADNVRTAARWDIDLSRLFGSTGEQVEQSFDATPPPPAPAPVEFVLADGEAMLRMSAAGIGHGTEGDNRLVGTKGDGVLFGGEGNDNLRGDGGDDRLFGQAGKDRLVGGGGNDWLGGGADDDWLEGGSGDDVMTGGAGVDNFVWRTGDLAGRDVITDFPAGIDKLDFRGVDLDPTTAAREKLSWIGEAAFGHLAGQVRWQTQGEDGHVSGDLDGDRVADLLLVLQHARRP